LNVTPDHFDRYPDVETYALARQRLIENLGSGGVAVLNRDDARVAAMADETPAAAWWFATATSTIPGDGAGLRGDLLVPAGRMQSLGEIDLTHPRLLGVHNRENALAAFVAVAALGYGGPDHREALLRGYRGFAGLEHRLELAGEVGGVRFINDSKATNDDAAAIGVRAMDRPVVLLAGGRGKGAGYSRLVEAAEGRVRAVIAFGEDSRAIAEAFAGRADVAVCDGLDAAFAAAVDCAEPGEAVLLAPACASFDQFPSYVERGRAFKALVRRHAGDQA
jgi:UDP-N-acetylmuramoylalanine--D-glutamate ligase